MASQTREWYRQEARRLYEKKRDTALDRPAIEIENDSDVSAGEHPGGWVQAWIWVPDPRPSTPETP